MWWKCLGWIPEIRLSSTHTIRTNGSDTIERWVLNNPITEIDREVILADYPNSKAIRLTVTIADPGRVIDINSMTVTVRYRGERHPTICSVDDVKYSSALTPTTEGDNLFDGEPDTTWHSKVGVFTEDANAIPQSTDLKSSNGPLAGQWVTCRLPPGSTVYGYIMRQRYPAYDNFFDHSNVGHPRGWSIVTSDDGDIWQFAQRDLKDTWTGELRVQLAEPIVNAKYIGIIVHSVSGARGISPTWCAFNGLDFQCM